MGALPFSESLCWCVTHLEDEPMKPLAIIAVGGTIDAEEYDFQTGSVVSFGKPAAVDIVKKTMPGIASENIILTSPFQKDSDLMTDEDREVVLEACRRCESDRIVITHGSGTLIETGRVLAAQLKNKTVVLTTSLPYTHDPVFAAFNMGSAIAACKLLPHGVYITTGGETVSFDAKKINKVQCGNVIYFREK